MSPALPNNNTSPLATTPRPPGAPSPRHTPHWLNYLLLGLFLYIAYLPLSSFLFAVKNDALTQNFPHKYFLSAALHSGFLPLWNPYVNFGLPLSADPGFAFWQPLTWLFGFIGYSVHTLAVEILTYIWLGGIFMYRLGLYLGHSRLTAFILGILYMCCGFFIGNLAHTNFLTCAAFLPVVTQCFLKLQTSFTPKRLLQTALACYLLAAGGHPAIPIGALYFFAAVLIALRPTLKTHLKTNLLLVLAIAGLTAPILFSWSGILPYINRSTPVFQPAYQDLGFTLPSYLSFLFPFATTAHTTFFGTDPSMRNGYFSFIGLALFILALTGKKNRLQKTFLIAGTVMLLLSLGAPIKNLLYSHLPLLRLIRTNGEYRVFALFSFIIVLSWPLEALLKQDTPTRSFTRLMSILAIIAILTLAISAPFIHLKTSPAEGLSGTIKSFIDTLTLPTRLFIDSAILTILLTFYFIKRNTSSPKILIPAIIMADLILFCWMQLPVTGVQRRSPSDIESLYSSVPEGIPLPRLSPIADNTRQTQNIIGCWSCYSKQPGTPELCNYPTLFKTTEDYFHSGLPDSLNKRPFLFLAHSNISPTLAVFSPATIIAQATSPTADTLILMQNDFPGWETTIDGHPAPHILSYHSFIGIPFKAGAHRFEYRFTDTRLIWYVLISLFTIIVLSLATLASRPPPIGDPHIPSLDGLRGLAILLVIAYHYFDTAFSFGWMGVDLFFVLSGYLITGRLLRTLGQPGFFTTFYRNRILRIFPLYFGTLLAFFTAVIILSRHAPHPLLSYYQLHWKSFFLFTQNWTFIHFHLPPGPYLTHFWTLGIEEQFYLFWPLLIFCLRQTRNRLGFLTALFFAILILRCTWFYLQPHQDSQTFFYFNTVFRMDSLVLGATLTQLHFEGKQIPRRTFNAIFLLSGFSLMIAFIAIRPPYPWHPFFETAGYSLLALFAACLIHRSVAYPNSILTRILSNPILRFIGKISFGLYVFHFLIYQIAGPHIRSWLAAGTEEHSRLSAIGSAITCLLITAATACLSYYYFERPFLRLKKNANVQNARNPAVE